MKKSSEDLLVDVSTIQAENEALREQLTDLQFRLKAAEERRDSKDRYTDHEVGAATRHHSCGESGIHTGRVQVTADEHDIVGMSSQEDVQVNPPLRVDRTLDSVN